MSSAFLHYRIRVTGRVQGVGYRAFALRLANRLDLRGFVQNLPDGTVLIEAEGTANALNQFIIECKKGPGWAHVSSVDYSKFPVQSFEDFRIKY